MNLFDSFMLKGYRGTEVQRLGDIIWSMFAVCQISVLSTAPVYLQGMTWGYDSLHPKFYLPTHNQTQISVHK